MSKLTYDLPDVPPDCSSTCGRFRGCGQASVPPWPMGRSGRSAMSCYNGLLSARVAVWTDCFPVAAGASGT